MEPDELDDLQAILAPLLRAVEALGFVSRYMHPPDVAALVNACGTPDQTLAEALPRISAWPDGLADLGASLRTASEAVIRAFAELRAAAVSGEDLGAVFRALRHRARALEALYPLARHLPPVSRLFLDRPRRDDLHRLQSLSQAAQSADTGIFHVDNEPGVRGGYSIYVPEDHDPAVALPLVMALHGGSGHGRAFLWSWLADARTYGAILVAPTSVERTWAINGPDPDTPNLASILSVVRGRWNVDPERLLLAGMSDGGTFAAVSGLEPGSPFTHLAPTSCAFHPMLAQMADPDRLRGLPIYLTHGALDWMFPVAMARAAHQALQAAGAQVSYREVDDLSHTYPTELNADVLDWLRSTHGVTRGSSQPI
jgi:phospholipase/carboxylesterase